MTQVRAACGKVGCYMRGITVTVDEHRACLGCGTPLATDVIATMV